MDRNPPAYRLIRRPVKTAEPPVLDAAQREVVDHSGGPLLVLAGPGTGKTTAIVETVADRILRRGLQPGRVLVLTFSRKAAQELRERITLRLDRTTTEPLALTFHSYAYALVRREFVLAGDEPPILLSGPEQLAEVRRMLRGEAVDGAAGWPDRLRPLLATRGFAAELRDFLLRAAERGLDGPGLARLGEAAGRDDWAAAGLFLTRYAARFDLAPVPAYDYAEIVRLAGRLLGQQAVRQRERRAYDVVIVDEYQDTDPAQEQLLHALAGDGRELIVVGDPDQSIYAFRGADSDAISRFPARFCAPDGSPARVLALRTGRRGGPALLAASRRVAARLPAVRGLEDPSAKRNHRGIVPLPSADPGDVAVIIAASVRQEATLIADTLRRAHLIEHLPWSSMAVLVRSATRQVPVLQRALASAGVPVAVAGDELPLTVDPGTRPLLQLIECALHPQSMTEEVAADLLTGPLGGTDALGLRRLRRLLRSDPGDPDSDLDDSDRGEEVLPAPHRFTTITSSEPDGTAPGGAGGTGEAGGAAGSPAGVAGTGRSPTEAGAGGTGEAGGTAGSPAGVAGAGRRSAEPVMGEAGGVRESPVGATGAGESPAGATGAEGSPGAGEAMGGPPEAGPLAAALRDPRLLTEAGFAPGPRLEVAQEALTAAGRVAQMLNAVRTVAADGTAQEVLWAVWSSSGLATRWQATSAAGGTRGAAADADADAVMTLFDAAARFDSRMPPGSMSLFLDSLTGQEIVGDTLAQRSQRGDAVAIMTAHRAKGLEWDLVVVAGVQEGSWPDLRLRGSLLGVDELVEITADRSPMSRSGGLGMPAPDVAAVALSSKLLDEERRLFYVAVTRPRRRLVVTAVSGDDGDDRPSRFLAELAGDDIAIEQVAGVGRRWLSLSALTAELRRAAADTALAEPVRRAAASQLARLAAAGVSGASPEQWYALTAWSGTGPISDGSARISPSQVDKFVTCGFRWLLESAVGASPPSSSGHLGIVIHAAAALAAEGLDRADIAKRIDEIWHQLDFGSAWYGVRQRERAELMIAKFLDWQRQNPRDLIAVEQRLRVRIEQILITGQVDRLERDADGKAVVVDLKTGTSKPSASELQRNPQLGVYQLAILLGAFAEFGMTEPGGAELVQVGKASPAAQAGVQQQRPLGTDPDPRWALTLVEKVAAEMAGPQFSATVNDRCRTCAAAAACPVDERGAQVTP